MITRETQLWRTLFSRLWRSINRQSSAKFPQFALKFYSRYQFLCQSPGNLAASCSTLSSSRSRMPDEASWIRMTQPRDMRLFRCFFFYHISRPRTSTVRALSLIGCWWLFLPSHKAVLPAFNWSLSLVRDQWSHRFRPKRRRHRHPLRSWCRWLPSPPQGHCVKYTLISYRPENTLTLANL